MLAQATVDSKDGNAHPNKPKPELVAYACCKQARRRKLLYSVQGHGTFHGWSGYVLAWESLKRTHTHIYPHKQSISHETPS